MLAILSILILSFNGINCDTLSYGTLDLSTPLLWSKELFNTNSSIPTNYTLIYKYLGIKDFSPLFAYVELRIDNNTSNGTLKVDVNNRNIDATVNIVNGTNVTVTLSVYGFGGYLMDLWGTQKSNWLSGETNTLPKSVTIIQIQNATQGRFKHNGIGRRQPGDQLIYFKSHNVSNSNKFAEKEFEFYGNDKQSITFVGFSFDSPTAVAFLNSTFIQRNEFSAVVYDLTMPHFVANMTVYGYENARPSDYKPLVDEKK